MELDGIQFEQLSNALRAAFNYNRLERMLRFRLDVTLQDITLADDYEQVVFDVIDRSQAEGWTVRLVASARDSVPGNEKLLAFAQQCGLASTDAPTQQLEQTIVATNSFLDVDRWRTLLGQLEPRVCRVEVALGNATSYGTGFLVGPDVVVTNYHVAEPVIMGEQGKTTASGRSGTAKDVVLRFDYKRTEEGVVNPGSAFALAANWLVDSSPVSEADLKGGRDRLPTEEELDFALLRVERPCGDEPIGSAEPGAQKRGWVAVPEAAPDFVADSPLFILQHPDAAPLKLALDTNAVIDVNANGTRVFYRTNTEPGSSGSPCFDQNWQLVGLHHSGDPNFDRINPAQFNRGIPIAAIRRLLAERGRADVLAAAAD
jgi:hypothetical protein